MTVKELESVGIIKEMYLKKSKNMHSSCRVHMLLTEEEKVFDLTKKIGLSVVIEDDNRIYMRGTIRKATITRTFSGSIAVVEIISYSDKIDRERKNRIFQNTKKKCKEIISGLDNDECSFQITDKELADLEEQLIIIQNEQTDFEFAKFIANKYGQALFVNDTDRKCVINIGQFIGKTRKKLTEDEFLFECVSITEEKEEVTISTHQYLEFGQTMIYENQEYTIISVIATFKNDVITFKYVLERKLDKKQDKEFVDLRLGKAKVTSNQDPEKLGRIQVTFLEYEDKCVENQIWVNYVNTLTEKEQGLVLVPSIGEIVSVACVKGRCYADGCIRETALMEQISDVENRTIMFGNKLFSIKKDKLEMEVFSYKVIFEEKCFTVTNDNNSIKIDDEKISWKNGKTKININKNTIQLLAEGKVELKANNINMDGSSKISAKTSLFDVG